MYDKQDDTSIVCPGNGDNGDNGDTVPGEVEQTETDDHMVARFEDEGGNGWNC